MSASDSEDEVLEIRPRSRSSSSSSRPALPPSAYLSHMRPPLARTFSSEKEHVTIAPIAPTLLKATVGDDEEDEDALAAYSMPGMCPPGSRPLVYVPRVGSNYSLLSPSRSGSSEDVHYHREAHFSIGTGYRLPPTPSTSDISSLNYPLPQRPRPDSRTYFPGPAVSTSPDAAAGADVDEDAYDYFGGPPDMGDEYAEPRASYAGRRSRPQRGENSEDTVTSPEVVIDDGTIDGMMEHSDTSSKTSSGLRTPSPDDTPQQAAIRIAHSAPVPVPRTVSGPTPTASSPPSSTAPPTRGSSTTTNNARLLSPPDAGSLRGRPTSPTLQEPRRASGGSARRFSADRQEDNSRGRSATRNSSFSSEREHSSSRGNNSPLGSISPSGSLIGVGGVGGSYSSAYAGGRETRGRSSRCSSRVSSAESLNSLNGDRERGRGRATRRLSESLSPPVAGATAVSSSPVVGRASASTLGTVCEDVSCTSGSSTPSERSATTTVKPSGLPTPIAEEPEPTLLPAPVTAPVLAQPQPQQQQQQVSQQRVVPTSVPTPANSPVLVMKRAMPVAPPSPSEPTMTRDVSPPSSVRTSQSPPPTSARHEGGKRRKLSGSVGDERVNGSLVGRTVDAFSAAARGFMGQIWHNNA
jgi:hypothetical protein